MGRKQRLLRRAKRKERKAEKKTRKAEKKLVKAKKKSARRLARATRRATVVRRGTEKIARVVRGVGERRAAKAVKKGKTEKAEKILKRTKKIATVVRGAGERRATKVRIAGKIRAARAIRKGERKAERKLRKAEKKTAKAEKLREKAALAKGVTATLYGNEFGGHFMTVKWNYEGGDKSPRYDHHEIYITSTSILKDIKMKFSNIDASQFEWTTPDPIYNVKYKVKVYGAKDSSGSITELIGECVVKKI